MPRPVVAFLTDFGTTDVYVGVMKGVVLGICPDAALVDVTHALAAQDLHHGAQALAAAYPHFPLGTVFVVVVDPGVGFARRGRGRRIRRLSLRGARQRRVDASLRRARRRARRRSRESAIPAGGREPHVRGARSLRTGRGLARQGVPLEALGPAITDPQRIALSRPDIRDTGIDAHVIHVDRFGNLITDLSAAVLQRVIGSDRVRIEVGNAIIDRISGTYSDVSAGDVCALIGSTDALEIACRDGSAASRLGMGRGAIVSIRRAV